MSSKSVVFLKSEHSLPVKRSAAQASVALHIKVVKPLARTPPPDSGLLFTFTLFALTVDTEEAVCFLGIA